MSTPTPTPDALGGRSPRQWEAYAHTAIKRGVASSEVANEMVAAGMPTHEALAIAQKLLTQERKHAGLVLGVCGLWFLVATGVTISAFGTGGGYIWYGGVICGLVGTIYGITKLTRLK